MRAPEGDVVWRARRGVCPAAGGVARLGGEAEPGLRRARPTGRLLGSEAGERARQEVRNLQPVRRPPSGPQTVVLRRRVAEGGV